jgi:hypothetical protein
MTLDWQVLVVAFMAILVRLLAFDNAPEDVEF